MNVTQHSPNLSIPTITNQATQSLQRENTQRDLITQTAATNPSFAEKKPTDKPSTKKQPSIKKEDEDQTGSLGKCEFATSNETVIDEFIDTSSYQQKEKQNKIEQKTANELEQRDTKISKRSGRIASYYQAITIAYNKKQETTVALSV